MTQKTSQMVKKHPELNHLASTESDKENIIELVWYTRTILLQLIQILIFLVRPEISIK